MKLKVGKLDQQKWELFLKGSGIVDRSKFQPNPDSVLIEESSWDLLNKLQGFPEFQGITEHIAENLPSWKIYQGEANIMEAKIPLPNREFDLFDRLLMVKIFKQQEMLNCINYYI